MPSFIRSFLTLFFLGILVPLFEGAPIARPENEGILPRISYDDHDPSIHPREPSGEANSQFLGRRSLHPADVNVNSNMVPRSLHAQVPLNAELEPRRLHRRHLYAQVPLNEDIEPRSRQLHRRHLVAQVPLNEDIEPRRLHRRHLVAQVPLNEDIEPRRLHRRHLVAQVPLNEDIEPRRLHRRHLFAQVPLNAEIDPRDQDGLERRGLDDAGEDEEPENHELKLPHHRIARVFARAPEDPEPSLLRRFVIPFTVEQLRPLTWSPVVFPFVSVPSYTFSAPGFKAHHVEHAGGAPHSQIDPSVHKKTEDDIEFPSSTGSGGLQGDPSLVLQPRKGLTTRALPGSKMKAWSMSVHSHSEETIENGHRKGNAQELITVHSAHSPSEAEAKKNGGKLVESGEAVLITAKTPKEGANAKASDKPEVTVDYAVLEPKKHKTPEEKDDDADAHPKKSASPSGAGAEKEGRDDSDEDKLGLLARRWFDSL